MNLLSASDHPAQCGFMFLVIYSYKKPTKLWRRVKKISAASCTGLEINLWVLRSDLALTTKEWLSFRERIVSKNFESRGPSKVQ